MLWRGDLSGVLFVARLPFVGRVILQQCGPLRRGGLLSTCQRDRRLGCNGTVVCACRAQQQIEIEEHVYTWKSNQRRESLIEQQRATMR